MLIVGQAEHWENIRAVGTAFPALRAVVIMDDDGEVHTCAATADGPAVGTLAQWLADHPQASGESRAVLSLAPGSRPLLQAVPAGAGPVVLLSGPEGGLSPQEEAAALAAGFAPITLGPRVLRAETAPLAALALLDQG